MHISCCPRLIERHETETRRIKRGREIKNIGERESESDRNSKKKKVVRDWVMGRRNRRILEGMRKKKDEL